MKSSQEELIGEIFAARPQLVGGKAYTYDQYMAAMAEWVKNQEHSGKTDNEDLIHYTMLNERRMLRAYKQFKVDDSEISRITQKQPQPLQVLALTESWCGDAAHTLPIIYKICEALNWPFRLVLRDENLELMDQFLTNRNRAIAKVLFCDQNYQVIAQWGPRPSPATTLVSDYKLKHGTLTPEFKHDLQLWYNNDKGESTAKDVYGLLS